MATNEDGEFELILGNTQILSVFFIVVILLGVFFTMGYIVGRNSVAVTAEGPRKPEAKPIVVNAPSQTATSPAETASTPPADSPNSVPVRTAPQQPPDEKAPPKEEAAAAPAQPKTAPPASSDHPSGTYLQLAATTKQEADIEVDALRHKGFKAIDAEIPEKPGTFRVLVGPVADGAINKIKADLTAAGLPGDKAIKKTF